MPDFAKITGPNAGADAFDQVIDDAYYTGQSDGGNGGPLSSYLLNHMARWANYAYVKLFDKDPGNITPRDYRGSAPRGHDHSGDSEMGEFIGVNLAAVIQGVENGIFTRSGGGATDGHGTSHYPLALVEPIWLGAPPVQTWYNASYYEDSYAVYAGVARTIPALTVGPGVNRLRTRLLVYVIDGTTGAIKTGALAGKIQIKLTTAAGTITASLSVSGGVTNLATGWLWVECVDDGSGSHVAVTAGAENYLDIEISKTNTGDDVAVLIYGYVLGEERA